MSEDIFTTATVMAVNPKTMTCDVIKTTGGCVNGVPIINSTGGILSDDVGWFTDLRGAVVIMIHMFGQYYILGTLPTQSRPSDSASCSGTNTGTGGDNTDTYGKSTYGTYNGGRNTGFLPGDKVLRADGGAEIGLYSEGLAVLKASPMAQLVLGSLMDFAKLIAREFKILTDFGEVSFTHNSSGRASMNIVGGAASATESNPADGADPQWTVHMHLGDVPQAPDLRFGVRVNDLVDGEFGAMALGADGTITLASSQDHLLSVAGNSEEKIVMSKYTEIDESCYEKIAMDHEDEVGGNHKHSVTGEEEYTVLQDRDVTIGANETHMVGENRTLTVNGVLEINAGSLSMNGSFGSGSGDCTVRCKSLNIIKA